MNKKETKMYEELIANGIATDDEIDLVRSLVKGSWKKILTAILYTRTGLESFDDLTI